MRKEVVRGDGAESGGKQPGPEAAKICGYHYGGEEGHVRDCVSEHRPKQPPDQERRHRGQNGHAVGKESGAWSFVHASSLEFVEGAWSDLVALANGESLAFLPSRAPLVWT